MAPTTIDTDSVTTDATASGFDDWITAGYYAPDFRTTVEAELDRLCSLPDNWDSQGASPIDSDIVEAARRFIEKLPANTISPPAVVPMAKGNLQFEWHEGPRSLELEIEDPTTMHYLKWHPEEDVEEEGVFPLDDLGRAIGLIRWFVRGVANV